MHLGTLPRRRVLDLSPLVFSEARRDEVAAGILERLLDELAAFVRASVTRLGLTDGELDVALGGGVAQSLDGETLDALARRLADLGPAIELRPTQAPPVLGAALCALGAIGAGPDAQERLRKELAHG
jgi:hypothetical protein